MDKNRCTSCGEAPKKCSCKNKEFTKAIVEINNPEEAITLMRKVVIPASMGDDTTVPPVVGKYKNVLLFYEANSKSYLYSSDGIPTQLINGFTNYEEAINLPEINGVTLMGNKSSTDLKLADAPMVITVATGNTSWSGADTAEDVYNFFLNKGKVSLIFEGGENYAYEITSAAYIPEEEKMMCIVTVATATTGETIEFDGNALFGTMTLYTADKAIDVSQIELQPKLYVADFTGLDLNDNELSGVPATDTAIGMVKPGDGLEVASDGTLSISEIEQYAHFFDTVADMKAADLADGSYARTLGYYSKDDGGGALYKIREITNSDVVDEATIISMVDGNLIAELIFNNTLNTKQLGCYGDNDHDDTAKIQNGIDILKARNGGILIFKDGNYKITRLEIDAFSGNIVNNITLISENKYGAKLYSTGDSIILFDNHGEGVIIDGLYLYGDNTNTGIKSNCSVANSVFKNIKIEHVYDGINISNSHWLLTFSDIVIKPQHDGLHLHTEGTSSALNNIYVYGGSGVAYYLGGAYSSATNLACDNFSGLPYEFNYGIWTINSIGCEDPGGVNIIKLDDYCNVSIGNVYLRGVTNSTEYIINERGHNNLIIGTLRMNSSSATNLDTQLMTFGNGYDVVQIDKINTLNTTFKADSIEYFSRAGKCTAIIEGQVYRLNTTGSADNYRVINFNDDESLEYYYGTDKASIIWCKENPKTINGFDSSWLSVGKEGKVIIKTDFSTNAGILGYTKIVSGSANYRDDANFGKIPLILATETASRPAADRVTGQCVFDTTLGKPIWYTGSGWVDATGASV